MYVLLVLLLLVPAMGSAQTIELSPSQLQYNEEAIQLLKAEQYTEAISKLEASLILGESNIVLLNLGRAHQRMGNCAEARRLYARVPTVPQVTSPTPDEIAKVLDRFQNELPEVCPSKITLKCANDVVSVRAGNLELSCSETTEMQAGDYVAVVSNSFGSQNINFTLEPEQYLTLSVQGPEPARAEAERSTNPFKVGGIVLGSVGTVAVVTSLILDSFWLEDRNEAITTTAKLESAQDKQAINKILLFSGAGILAVGITTYIIGSVTQAEVVLVPQLGTDYAGLGIDGRW